MSNQNLTDFIATAQSVASQVEALHALLLDAELRKRLQFPEIRASLLAALCATRLSVNELNSSLAALRWSGDVTDAEIEEAGFPEIRAAILDKLPAIKSFPLAVFGK